jgi:hypothetical protein
MIIGIAGQALSGKDTLAAAISKHLWVSQLPSVLTSTTEQKDIAPILHFADALRDAVEAIFGCRYETQEEKAAIDTWWQERIRAQRIDRGPATDLVLEGMLGDKDLIGRWILQFVGTEVGRHRLHKDIWLYALERRISKSRAPHHIISDVRFDNEAEWVRKQGGIVIQIKREGRPEPAANAHASEKGVNPNLIDTSFTSDSVAQTQYCGSALAVRILTGWKAAGKM